MIHFSCKWCGKRYHAPARFAGRSEACNACGKPVFVPKTSNAQGPSLHFACPRCGKRYRTRLRYAGVTQICRGCGETIQAPDHSDAAPAPTANGAVPAATFSPATGVPPVESPFEIGPTTEAQKLAELEAYLDLPPFELVPTVDEFPDAPFVDDDEVPKAPVPGAPAAALQPPPPIAPPPTPAARLPAPPTAPVAPPPPIAIYVPPAPPPQVHVPPPPSPPPSPSHAAVAPPAPVAAATPPKPRMEDLPEAPLVESEPSLDLPPKPDPPPKPKGCPSCGVEGSYNLHARSPMGILAMIFGTLGGLGGLLLVEDDPRYGIAAGACFVIAIIGAFLKRWTIICSGCERRLY